MKYKVFFYQGDELSLRTRVAEGHAWLDAAGLHISGNGKFLIPSDDIVTAELFRLNSLGRVIRVEHLQGRLFLSVVRFMVGQFALINFSKTGTLHKELSAIANPNVQAGGSGS